MKKKLAAANKDVLIGEILRHQRTILNLSQRDIAHKLGYRNINFISMIERGNSKLPFSKLPEIVSAYQLDKSFLAIMVRGLYPDIWNVFIELRYYWAAIFDENADVDDVLDDILIKAIKDFRIKLE